MGATIRRWLSVAARTGLLLLIATRACHAAGPPATPPALGRGLQTTPQPVEAQAAEDRPPAYVLPPPPELQLPEFVGLDPLLDRPQAPLPGLFVNLETNVVSPHLTNQLRNTVVIGARTDLIQFPGNRLDWTVMPRFEVGYRLPDGWGALVIGYRFLTAEGSDLFTVAEGAPLNANQKGRLDMNLIDLDYSSREYSLGPDWEMRWSVGARALFLYFDSRLDFLNPAPSAGDFLSQTETNHLYVFGFHGVFELDRQTPIPGLAAFGRLEGSGMVGRIGQTFSEELAGPTPGGPALFGQTRVNHTAGIPTLGTEIGLSYTLPGWNNSRLLIGYLYDSYFDIGRIAESGARAQLNVQGLFLRAEFNY